MMNASRRQRFIDMVTKHGLRSEPEYHLWLNIKQRCSNPKNKSYKYYGERGIKVCDEWEQSFKKFYKDMGKRPSPQHQIDRVDNNKGYEADNCRWVNKTTQMRNTSIAKYWYVNGVKYESLTHAADSLSVTINTIKRWCEGLRDYRRKIKSYKDTPAKPNCWSELKYDECNF